MPYDAKIIELLVISPSDVGAERDQIDIAVTDWNSEHGKRRGVHVVAKRWERDARSQFGDESQQVINQQLVCTADIAIGTFWTKLGTQTKKSASGSAEEIKLMADNGRPVSIFFSTKGLPVDIDIEELARLRQYKDAMKKIAIVMEFDSLNGLANLARKHITSMVDQLLDDKDINEAVKSDTAKSAANLHDRVIAESESLSQDRELASESDDSDDAEEGILDLTIEATEAIESANDSITKINDAMVLMSSKLEIRTAEMNRIMAELRAEPKKAKKWIDGAAEEMNDFAYIAQEEAPVIDRGFGQFLSKHSKVIELMDATPQPKSEIEGAISAGEGLVETISELYKVNANMIATVTSLPPLTGKFNNAKSRVNNCMLDLTNKYEKISAQTSAVLALYKRLLDEGKYIDG